MDAWTPDQRKALGARLREARMAKGRTLADVGAMFDTGKATVGHWETGTNMPSAEQIARLAVEFGVPADKLLFGLSAPAFAPEVQAKLQALPPEVFRRVEDLLRTTLSLTTEAAAPPPAAVKKRPPEPSPPPAALPRMVAEFDPPKEVSADSSRPATMNRKRLRP